MAERKKILAISGSLRSNSVNELLLKFIAAQYSTLLDIQIYRNLGQLPHFNLDLDDDKLPDLVRNLREQMSLADGVLICTPEYVFSLPSALKNALEWTVPTTVFSDKPVAFIVASGLGEKAYESLHLILTTLGVQLNENAGLLLSGARSKLNIQGEVTDEQTLRAIEKLMASFIETMDGKVAVAPVQ